MDNPVSVADASFCCFFHFFFSRWFLNSRMVKKFASATSADKGVSSITSSGSLVVDDDAAISEPPQTSSPPMGNIDHKLDQLRKTNVISSKDPISFSTNVLIIGPNVISSSFNTAVSRISPESNAETDFGIPRVGPAMFTYVAMLSLTQFAPPFPPFGDSTHSKKYRDKVSPYECANNAIFSSPGFVSRMPSICFFNFVK
mmetsp:Transcript_110/g.318  ORF Transcript_110/g.318 Transcript_110/m.318 type:complete len:200 (-) Transcript_110:494-1093(-)